jgi:hypothetical protein
MMNSYKCGCLVLRDSAGGYFWQPCRFHKAAPDLLKACKYVVNWHRENDSGEGELFGLDFVTTCINAISKATE